jgi:glucosylceramidase
MRRGIILSPPNWNDLLREKKGVRVLSAGALGVASCLLALAVLPAGAQTKDSVSMWLTTQDRTSLEAKQPEALRFTRRAAMEDAPQGKQPPAILRVDDKQKFQTVDGFGFALTGGSAQLMMKMDAAARAALIQNLVGTGPGELGVNYLRVSIGSSDMNDHVFTYDDMPAGQTDESLAHFDLGPDKAEVIPVLKEALAINPKIKILASPWSAPSWMKTNDLSKGGRLKVEDYGVYAVYLVKYLRAMKAEGIAIDAITIQNEPLNPKNTPSMVMTAEEQAKFIDAGFGKKLKKSGLKTKIIDYDHNCDRPDYATTVLADPVASKYVDGSGFHLYGGTIDAMSKVHDAYPKKNLYFTEQMVTDRRNDTMLRVASPVNRIVIGAMRNWSRNALLWNLAADAKFGPHTSNGGCPVCEGAITIEGDTVTRNLAYYTIAPFSEFVRPGAVRVESDTKTETLGNVAFRTKDGRRVLVVANTAREPQPFAIVWRGKRVETSLPAGAVATYVW